MSLWVHRYGIQPIYDKYLAQKMYAHKSKLKGNEYFPH